VKRIATFAASIPLALALQAQQISPAPRDEKGYTLQVQSNLVFLPTRVQTKKGDTIYELTEDRFIVEDDGVRQAIRIEESPDSESVSLVVAVQCGRSAVAEFDKLKGLGTMLEGIVGSGPHEVAVVVYGERPYLLSDFSSSEDATRLALSRLKPCGDYHAAAIDAVHYSLNLLEQRRNRYRRAILLIGEERDHGSTSKLHEVVGELGATDTVIYTIAFSPTKSEFLSGLRYGPDGPKKPEPPAVYSATPQPVRRTTLESQAEQPEGPKYTDHVPSFTLPPLLLLAVNALRDNTAAELAALSGGEYMNFVTQRGLEQALQRVANHVHNYYLLSFKPTSSSKLGLHSIRVSVAGHPDAVIQTRKNYWSGIPR
jgi:VWFA-related protein